MAKEYDFIVDGGQRTDERGKFQWPAMVSIVIPRDQLASIITQLVSGLDRNKAVTLSLLGEMIESGPDHG